MSISIAQQRPSGPLPHSDPQQRDPQQRAPQQRLLRGAQAYLRLLAKGLTPPDELEEAWDEFYRRFNPGIVRLARESCRSADAADDCVQTVWVEIVRKLPGLEYDPARGQLGTWLRTVAYRAVALFHRRESRHRQVAAQELPGSLLSREFDPAVAYERQQTLRVIRALAAEVSQRLSTTDNQVLELRLWRGYGVSEIAAKLEITAPQVRYRYHRATRKIHKLAILRRSRQLRDYWQA